jgi:AsmA protein
VTAATGFKRLGIAVAAVIVLATGALAAMSLLISPDRVREEAKVQIRSATGLDLTIRGEGVVSLFPTGLVRFSDVVLAEEGAREPALVTERLIARLRLLPLFVGRIEIADVTLGQPEINLTFAPDGRSNWSGLIVALARALDPKGNRADRVASFSEIRVDKGTINLRDAGTGAAERLTEVNLALAWPSISKSFGATGQVMWRGESIDVALSLSDFAAALAGERSGLKLRLNGTLINLAFDGSMSTRPTLKVDGTVSVASKSLRDTLRWAGVKPPPGGGFGPFALKAKASIAGGAISLAGVNLELDGNTAEGVLAFATDGRQTLQGTLAAEELDLTPYLSAVRLVTANERDWSELPIALEGLRGFDLDLRLSAAKIAIGRVKLGNTAVAANLRSGKLSLTVARSQAFGGLVQGSVILATTEAGAEFKSDMQFTDVDLDGCLGGIFNIRRIEGRGNLSLAVAASGHSVLALTQSMNGSVSLNARDGALLRINAEQLLGRLMRRPLSGAGDFRTGRTPFEKLVVNLKITRGEAKIEEARLEGTRVRMTFTGSSSIPNRDLDLRGLATLFANRASDAQPAFELAFAVTGPWDDPLPLFDHHSLIPRSPSARPLLKLNEPPASPPTIGDQVSVGAEARVPVAPADANANGDPPTEAAPAAGPAVAPPQPLPPSEPVAPAAPPQ